MEILANVQNIILKFLLNILLVITLVKGSGQQTEIEPEFLQPLDNLTVTQGRDISFTCVVNNLGQYRVAWIKSDSKAILAIHTHMVALNPRLSVTHNGHNTWKLHISHVQLNDSGSYMCQINFDPMRHQQGHLIVVVPPDILNTPDMAIDESVTNEGGSVQLVCQATGVPEPTVQWRREQSKDIVLRNDGRNQLVKHVEGERLVLNGVQRTDMGGYLCIATNGIPPSVSKRYDVQINFPPTMRAVNEIVAAPLDTHGLLQCTVEAFPKSLNGWYRDEDTKLYQSEKYIVSEAMINSYTWQMNLTVKNLNINDFAPYVCGSVNALGKSEARIRLQELRLPPKPTTTPTPYVHTTARPRKSQKNHHSKTNHDSKNKEAVGGPNQLREDVSLASEVLTQTPAKSAVEKARNTQTPAIPPTHKSWISHNSSNSNVRHLGNYLAVLVILVKVFTV